MDGYIRIKISTFSYHLPYVFLYIIDNLAKYLRVFLQNVILGPKTINSNSIPVQILTFRGKTFPLKFTLGLRQLFLQTPSVSISSAVILCQCIYKMGPGSGIIYQDHTFGIRIIKYLQNELRSWVMIHDHDQLHTKEKSKMVIVITKKRRWWCKWVHAYMFIQNRENVGIMEGWKNKSSRSWTREGKSEKMESKENLVVELCLVEWSGAGIWHLAWFGPGLNS